MNFGIVKEKLKKYDDAIAAYMESIEQKKDYIPAVIRLSRLHKKMGNKQQATEVIETALKYKPNSKVLMKKLKRLNK